MACPYDAIKWEEATGIVSKCHFCHERLAVGREPACVETCFAGALKQKLIIFDDLSNEYRKEIIGFKHIKSIGPALRFSESLTVMSSEDQEEVKIKRGQ
jgi:Fe-S-cluster-containing dehydrogenase component